MQRTPGSMGDTQLGAPGRAANTTLSTPHVLFFNCVLVPFLASPWPALPPMLLQGRPCRHHCAAWGPCWQWGSCRHGACAVPLMPSDLLNGHWDM